MTTLKTTSLGEIRGKNVDGVTHYLGIKYASLKNRLADAELIESRDGDVLDATRDGPTTISPPNGCDIELTHVQQTLPKKELAQSDVDCLNLNISVPEGTTADSKLPVFLFIHGGGLVLGANSWAQFDYTRLVKLSVKKNLPIVAVSMNYRLGAFGFLTSEELRKAGYKANNGLRDQRVAMQWVQKHIRDFGGDPENVTLAGMSAGAASVMYHIDCDQPLFKRAIAMSGSYFVVPALPFDFHEQNYKQAITALGLADRTPEERIKALLETPGLELISKLPPPVLVVAPAIDGDMVASPITYARVADKNSNGSKARNVCKDLMIGDANMDASILAFLMPHLQNGCAKKFVKAVQTVLSSHPAEAQKILDEYGVSENAGDEEAFGGIIQFINDIVFFAPVLSITRGWSGNAHVYYFNEQNPWEGPWKGKANHILDLAYLFQNFNEFLTPEQQAIGAAFAEDLFKFLHGVAPWPAVQQDEQGSDHIESGFTARVYGPSIQNVVASTVSQPYGGESQRRSILFDLADQGSLDELTNVFVTFRSS